MIEFTITGRCKAHGLNNRMDVAVLFHTPDSLLITYLYCVRMMFGAHDVRLNGNQVGGRSHAR
jgi:hypothetical protein